MSEKTFRTAKLRKKDGDYPKGLAITTDPSARWSPTEGKGPVFVDDGRFASWERDEFLVDVAEVAAAEIPNPAAAEEG